MKRYFWMMPVAMFALAPTFAGAQDPQKEFTNILISRQKTPEELAKRAALMARLNAAHDLLIEAKSAIKKGDLPSAFTQLQQALSLDPSEGEICLLLSYFYIEKGQPENVIATLGPIVYPMNGTNSTGQDTTTRMIYILALLDRNAWRDAVACYEKTWGPNPATHLPGYVPSHVWHLPGGGPIHTWPDPQFSADTPDYAGLRAQAHLVLGSTLPAFMEEKNQFPYMLEHLHQVLQINPNSLDATFLSGWLLGKMDRFAEARTAYASAAQLGSPAARKEIHEELIMLATREQTKKARDAQQAAIHAKPK